MIGQLIAHYRILSEIGSGGMGSVYRAQDEKSGREVALKILLREHAADHDMRGRFLHEARAQAMISHPNVAAFYEVGEDSGQVYIAMEFIQGPTLAEYASTHELLPSECLAIVVGIADGLQSAHANGVIHRDLKPANIMLTPDGQPKITDFGLARFKGATTITKTGRIIGTARYMSPEQAEGRRVDHRSDLFSLGIILYELICRRVPFSGDNDTAVLYELLTKDPQPLSRYANNVPGELDQVISKALAKSPDDRYQSAGELITDLKAVQERLATGRDITLKETLGSRRIWKRWTTYAAIVVLSVIATLIGRRFYQTQVSEANVLGLVVLPMSNIGAPDREYFTDGVTDEITTRLASISGLRVVSRTSAMRYKQTDKPIREIARELKVDLVVEGTVRWDSTLGGMRMRVTPRLLRARDERSLWSETYDRMLEEILLTQSEIAEAVTRHISEELDRPLILPSRALPTANADAYNYYLRGSEYLNRGFESPDLDIAIGQFTQAVALDPAFAAAHARLSRTHSKYYWFHEEGNQARLALARADAATALRLAPDLPEAHLALGYCLYWGDRDFVAALEEFVEVRNLEPSNADAHFAIGGILRRLGRFDEAVVSFRRAAELDALSANRAFEVGNTYYHMRQCAAADSFFSMAIDLAPDQQPVAYWRKTLNYIHCDGNTKRAREFVATWIDRLGADRFPQLLFELDRLDGRNDSALARISLSTVDSVSYFIKSAQVNRVIGRETVATAQLDSARTILESQCAANPDDPDLLGELSIVYARLGRSRDAVTAVERALVLRPIAKDAFNGPYFVEQAAEVYMLAGQHDQAISQLAILLASNNPGSRRTLLLDNTWSPLWEDEAFKRLAQ